MGDRVAARGVEAKVLAYGDRVVAQGDVASSTKAAPATAPVAVPPTPSVQVARLLLIDRKSLVDATTQKDVATRLESDLKALLATKTPKSLQAKFPIRFSVSWVAKWPTDAERQDMGKLDFPIYFEHAPPSNDALTKSELTGLMRTHGILEKGEPGKQYDLAEGAWENTSVEGLGIHPFLGYRKVGFIKVDRVYDPAKDRVTALTNVVKHEFGHMCNLDHDAKGLMKASVPLATATDFEAESKGKILGKLGVLAASSEAALQRAYEAAAK